MIRNLFLSIVMILLYSSCAVPKEYINVYYHGIRTGTLGGKLNVTWIKPDKFIFEPDEHSPLTFVRYNGERIQPGKMYTDGGSIPRPLWVLRDYSPWGYAPAYIIHDWLFFAHYCRKDIYDFNTSADIMAEVVKTMMEELNTANHLTLFAMSQAVRSPVALQVWNTGICDTPRFMVPRDIDAVTRYTIEFGNGKR